MNEFREPHLNFDNGRDPLERLVEAFVGLSAPEGPDAAVQQRLIARLSGAASAGAMSTLASDIIPQRHSSARWWVGALARQSMTLAAGVAVLVAAALWATSRRQGVPEQVARGGGGQIVATTANEDLVHNDVTAFLDRVLQSRGATPDILAMVSAMVKEQRELSKSPRWQKAQARLSLALEKPEVIGFGVGLLGTLPLASYGRF